MKQQDLIGLLKRVQTNLNFHELVKKRLEVILSIPVEVRQPKSVRGVYKLLCAIHTSTV